MHSSPMLKFIAGSQPIFNIESAILSAPVRHVFMMGTVWYLTKKQSLSELQILEVGSWIGGSALSWAQGVSLHHQGQAIITCVDAWTPFFNQSEKDQDTSVYQRMETALATDTAYQLFMHNISTLPEQITCQHLRGKSARLLPLLRSNAFDIIYIDGDHAYTPVLQDIQNALPLVREGGIICGDDLNLQLSQVDQTVLQDNAEKDFIKDPKTNRNYHPGVTLAVSEVFGDVSVWGGFWAMQKLNHSWHKISLQGMPIHFPAHFPEKATTDAKAHLADIKIL